MKVFQTSEKLQSRFFLLVIFIVPFNLKFIDRIELKLFINLNRQNEVYGLNRRTRGLGQVIVVSHKLEHLLGRWTNRGLQPLEHMEVILKQISLHLIDIGLAIFQTRLEPFRCFSFHPQIRRILLKTLKNLAAFPLLQVNFYHQIKENELKQVIFILLSKVLKFYIVLVELLVETDELE